jgi:iron complex transport system substrate-binding protein
MIEARCGVGARHRSPLPGRGERDRVRGGLHSPLVIAMTVIATACTRPAAPQPGAAANPRAISLHDVTTEIVVALGAVDRLVGVTGAVDQPQDVKAATRHLPAADGIESIIALRPTVVLGMEVVQRSSPDLVRVLRDRGVDVVLGDPHTLRDVFALVESIAAKLGRLEAGTALVAQLRARSQQAAVGRGKGSPLRTFVYDCCDSPFTAGGRAVLTDLVHQAGGQNVFADLDASWTKVAWEEVIARRPQLIIINDYDFSGQGDVADKRAQLRLVPSLAQLPTLVLPLGEALGGLRSVDGLERLGRAIASTRAGLETL